MLRLLAGSFLILHGLVHAAYLAPKPDDPAYPFVPDRTWFANAGWWQPLAVAEETAQRVVVRIDPSSAPAPTV